MLSPREAYEKTIIEGPSEYTRKAVLCDAYYSYWYALYVDKIIFIDSNDYIYFVDIHNIGMRYIREHKLNIGFMSVGCFYLDVL